MRNLPYFSALYNFLLRAPPRRCMAATEGSGVHAGSYSLGAADREAGGPQLRTTYLSPEQFEAAAMERGEQGSDGDEGGRAQGGAGGARRAEDWQQGVAAAAAARCDCEGAS